MKPCRLKDCKVTSLQSLEGMGMDPGPQWSIVILAESDQAILMIFNLQLWQPTTLQQIIIESLILPHLKDLIHVCLDAEVQDHGGE